MSFAGYFLVRPFCLLSMLISDSRFDLVWFRLSCDHGWICSGSVNVRKQQQQLRLYILWTRFTPSTYYVCTSVKSLVYMIQYHILCFKTYRYLLLLYCRPVFPLPTYACTSVKSKLYTVQYHPLCPNIITAVLLLYILWSVPPRPPPTYACQCVKSLVYTAQCYLLCFKT